MTLLCVAIFVSDPAVARAQVAAAAEAGADLVELRIDALVDEHVVRQVVAESILPCIVTCRPTWEGGHSTLHDEDRLRLLAVAADAGAKYVDVELATLAHHSPPLTHGTGGLIVSSHDFTGRPARLLNTLAAINDTHNGAATVTKLVWTARTLRDNLEAFEILLQQPKPTIALCMGEHGLISRVLAKKFGAFLTFASLPDSPGTAAGQIAVTDIKRLYRWDAITPRTKVFGVVGSPVAHSMSPALHNAAFDATAFDGVYLPLLVNPGYESFKAFLAAALDFAPLDLAGLSVTIPHKENALRFLQESGGQIDPLAARIGAVNTIAISRTNGLALKGTSTDYAAILDAICDALAIDRAALAGLRVSVLGAGGTGRTAVAALAHFGARVTVFNRTPDRAAALAAEFDGHTGPVAAAPIESAPTTPADVLINTTSVGMHPNVDASPLADFPPPPGAVVFDTVYNPRHTRLLAAALAAGNRIIPGSEMFLRQAAAQFELWTAQPAPLDAMRAVLDRRLPP